MTNEQLILLVRAWASRLEREIDWLDDALPVGIEREYTESITGVRTPTDAVLTLGLRDLKDELWEAVHELRGRVDDG